MWRVVGIALLAAVLLPAQPKRVLYLTHSAGYRHDSIPVSIETLRQIAAESGGSLEIVATEDVSMLDAGVLRGFDAVFFFTSGELPVSQSQKEDLLAFVRAGKGFGGVHSATDTFYSWPEYGELIGARFNGHPWVQPVTLDAEDPSHPAMAQLPPGFSILDEIYQFRDFSRVSNRVLMTLDTHSVDLAAAGVNPGTEDFPLAWCRNYGAGRVFYTALGHFDSTWRDAQFRVMMRDALRWITGQLPGDVTPRPLVRPSFVPEGIANSASFQPRMTISPGSLITMFGANLTTGSALAADARNPPYKLAGTTVKINGSTVPLLYASPSQINAYVPLDAKPSAGHYDLELSTAGGTAPVRLTAAAATPGIFTLTATREWVTLWGTGLGTARPTVAINGSPATILFNGLAPGWFGLYQVNVAIPAGTTFPARLAFHLDGFEQLAVLNP